VKKAILGLLVVTLSVCAVVGTVLWAQPQRPAINTMPKVAVINIRAVLKENKLAKAMQSELDEALKPYKAKADRLSAEITFLEQRNGPTAESVLKKRAEYDEVNGEILRMIDDKYRARMPRIWDEVNGAIEAVAKAYGFLIVLGHGDPEDGDTKMFQGSKTSKLRTTDMGGTVMPFVHGSVDITPIVIKMLNK
jgi:Skp family chaperone for outer membrane proteins